jgi:hypothetical protein
MQSNAYIGKVKAAPKKRGCCLSGLEVARLAGFA